MQLHIETWNFIGGMTRVNRWGSELWYTSWWIQRYSDRDCSSKLSVVFYSLVSWPLSLF